jgi:hypothetical protein
MMKYRKLRIAWSVAWGIVAVLLVALWARSYWWFDSFGAVPICGVSASGKLYLVKEMTTVTFGTTMPLGNTRLRVWSVPIDQMRVEKASYFAVIPTWVLISVSMFAAVSAWLRWRFTLRTLLIATTLVAVGLGLIVWLAS